MSNLFGMDLSSVQTVIGRFDPSMAEVKQKVIELQGLVESAVWQGPDRNTFVEEFRTATNTALQQLDQIMIDYKGQLQGHWNQQDGASQSIINI